MESNESGRTPFFHQQLHHQLPSALAPSPAAVNGLIPNHVNSDAATAAMYAHSFPGNSATAATVSAEPVKKKRGRPRKYDTPEAAAAAKKAAAQQPSHARKKEQTVVRSGGNGGPWSSSNSSSKKTLPLTMGDIGISFTPHVINVADGEDVAQKIMLFAQQVKKELCILSASGSVRSACLHQQATSGGNVTIEGHFHIVSLSGSYIRANVGERAGGLSACLCSAKGEIVGGGVGGPLVAAGPVEIIVGTFLLETKKETTTAPKSDANATTLRSPVSMSTGASTGTSTGAYRPVIETSGGYQVPGAVDHRNIAGAPYMISQGIHVQPLQSNDWNYNFAGQAGHGAHDSPENGDYDQLSD
ncbi:AT-hook motif nuclear-localized protein 14-like protein [Drosera capensis]